LNAEDDSLARLLGVDLYDTPIDSLDLSRRALRCLLNYGIDTVGKLLETSEGELMRLPNFGRVSLAEVMSALQTRDGRPTEPSRLQARRQPYQRVTLGVNELSYFRARLRNRVHNAVLGELDRAAEDKGVTLDVVARRLGMSRLELEDWLDRPGIWQLNTVSDLLLALGRELSVAVSPIPP
jgi:DNA-binding phage protein